MMATFATAVVRCGNRGATTRASSAMNPLTEGSAPGKSAGGTTMPRGGGRNSRARILMKSDVKFNRFASRDRRRHGLHRTAIR
jgi:hypothetical protein